MRDIILTTRGKIWPVITQAVKSTQRKCYVAVAYFGTGGYHMLALHKGSQLVVDASHGAVTSGQTNPSELLRLMADGVQIYSVGNLHAKVFVIGTRLFIGSNNVSAHSKDDLTEAVFSTTRRDIVQDARDFVTSLCTPSNAVGEEKMKQLSKIYKRPKFANGKKLAKGKVQQSKRRLYVAKLKPTVFNPEHEVELELGRAKAELNRTKRSDYRLSEIEWRRKSPVKSDDMLVQIDNENGRKLVSPPGRVLNVEPWRNKKGAYIFCEEPDRRRKTVDVIHRQLGQDILNRAGYKEFSFTDKIGALWR